MFFSTRPLATAPQAVQMRLGSEDVLKVSAAVCQSLAPLAVRLLANPQIIKFRWVDAPEVASTWGFPF